MVGQYTSYDWLPLVPFSMVWKTPDLKNDQENKPILIATRLWTWVLNCFYHLLPTWILISLLFEDMHSHDSSHSTQTSNYFLIRHDIIYRNLHVGIDVKNASSTTCLHTLIQCWKALIWSEWIYKLMPTHTRFNSHHDRRMSFQYQLFYWKCDQFSIVFILHFQFGF